MRRIDPMDHDEVADKLGVSNFAQAMRKKLTVKREWGKYGWNDPDVCTVRQLHRMLERHVEKGDMVDVGNIAMMIYNREHCMKESE